ncbi:MAG: twin-arginine translocase TatA/TatE family subunit [Nitrospirae bacterium]|nr:twin-arginine translocase TatA/TatE family subunit [Nitrospirota bacterium]
MFGIGFSELVVIFIVALLVFGPKRLPEVARKLSRGLKDLREAADDARSTILSGMDDTKTPWRIGSSAPDAGLTQSQAKPAGAGSEDTSAKPKSPPPATPKA